MDMETLATFAVTCFVIELTPGPNMAYLAVLSAGKGRYAGFAATAGIAIGLLIVGVGAALGLTALINGSRVAYEVLRWAGILYLLWLAYESWKEEEASRAIAALDDTVTRYFLRGLSTNILNPKAGIFYAAILPTFIDEKQSVVWQAIALTITYVTIATLVHSSIVGLAGTVRPWLADVRRSQFVRRLFSLLLVAVAIWLFAATRGSSN